MMVASHTHTQAAGRQAGITGQRDEILGAELKVTTTMWPFYVQ